MVFTWGKLVTNGDVLVFLWKYIDGKEEESMLDMVMILLTAGIFVLLVGFAHWCDRMEQGEDRS